jgi:competence protein ComEA
MLVKVIRLTFLAICLGLCFCLTGCTKSGSNELRTVKKQVETAENAINLNTAATAELEKLPRIGRELARRIVEFRKKNGKFRRAEHLILVRGMSDKKFRELQNLIKAE